MAKSGCNPKRLIVEYFDSLINKVDIYVEEMLETTTDEDEIIVDKDCDNESLNDSFTSVTSYDIENELDEHTCIRDENWNPFIFKNKFGHQIRSSIEFESESKLLDYYNRSRDEMIRQLNEIQAEVLRQFEAVHKDLNLNENSYDDVKEKVFATKFPIIIKIERSIPNHERLFKLYLVVLDFYLAEKDITILG